MSYRTMVLFTLAAALLASGCDNDTPPEQPAAGDAAEIGAEPNTADAAETADLTEDPEEAAPEPADADADADGGNADTLSSAQEIDACGLLTTEEAAVLADAPVEAGEDGLFQSEVVTTCNWWGSDSNASASVRVELHAETSAGGMPGDWEDGEGGFIRIEPVEELGPGAHLVVGGIEGEDSTDIMGLTAWSGRVAVQVSGGVGTGFQVNTDEAVQRHIEAARAVLERL